MKKTLYILFILFIPVISLSAVIKNQGTKIFLNNNVYMKVVNLEMKNENNGSIIVRDTSELRVVGANFINESGSVNLQDISILEVSENLINKGAYNNESSSHTIVKKNVVNSGNIYNASMIEIGE